MVIGSHSFICAGTKIGCDVFIGHGVVTCNDKYPVANNRAWICSPPTIDDGASIGSGAVILPGVTIGQGAIIGAGAIVTKDVPQMTVWIGKGETKKVNEASARAMASVWGRGR